MPLTQNSAYRICYYALRKSRGAFLFENDIYHRKKLLRRFRNPIYLGIFIPITVRKAEATEKFG